MTERADIWGFGSTVGYNLTPHYRLLGSLHVIEIFKTLAAENRGENLGGILRFFENQRCSYLEHVKKVFNKIL